MTVSTTAAATGAPARASLQSRALITLAALAIGLPLIWGAGFASADALHDTAHDARHAMGLPCH